MSPGWLRLVVKKDELELAPTLLSHNATLSDSDSFYMFTAHLVQVAAINHLPGWDIIWKWKFNWCIQVTWPALRLGFMMRLQILELKGTIHRISSPSPSDLSPTLPTMQLDHWHSSDCSLSQRQLMDSGPTSSSSFQTCKDSTDAD